MPSGEAGCKTLRLILKLASVDSLRFHVKLNAHFSGQRVEAALADLVRNPSMRSTEPLEA